MHAIHLSYLQHIMLPSLHNTHTCMYNCTHAHVQLYTRTCTTVHTNTHTRRCHRPAYGSPPILGPGGPICLGNWVPLPRQVGPPRTEMPRCKKLSRTQMPRQPGPPRTQLLKYILMYKHFTDKARDHRRPLDETQGGGGGGGGVGVCPPPLRTPTN